MFFGTSWLKNVVDMVKRAHILKMGNLYANISKSTLIGCMILFLWERLVFIACNLQVLNLSTYFWGITAFRKLVSTKSEA